MAKFKAGKAEQVSMGALNPYRKDGFIDVGQRWVED